MGVLSGCLNNIQEEGNFTRVQWKEKVPRLGGNPNLHRREKGKIASLRLPMKAALTSVRDFQGAGASSSSEILMKTVTPSHKGFVSAYLVPQQHMVDILSCCI